MAQAKGRFFFYEGSDFADAMRAFTHQGGRDVTEDRIRQRLVAKRLILHDHEYAECGFERIPGTSGLELLRGGRR